MDKLCIDGGKGEGKSIIYLMSGEITEEVSKQSWIVIGHGTD